MTKSEKRDEEGHRVTKRDRTRLEMRGTNCRKGE
jgi:hypothetical protein